MPSYGCVAIVREFKSPMSDLAEHPEPPNDEEAIINATPSIDIEKTFSPRPRFAYIEAKLFIVLWLISITALSIGKYDYPDFWMAYLTHWTILLTVAYSILSFFSAAYLAMCPPADPSVLEGGTGLMIKTMWVSFYNIVLTPLL